MIVCFKEQYLGFHLFVLGSIKAFEKKVILVLLSQPMMLIVLNFSLVFQIKPQSIHLFTFSVILKLLVWTLVLKIKVFQLLNLIV